MDDVLDFNLGLLSQPKSGGPEIINEVDSCATSYEQFFLDYLLPNQPCLLQNISNEWICQKQWITNGKPDFDLLRTKYGETQVPVANCNKRYFNAQSKCSMKMEDFLLYWQDLIKNNHDPNVDCFYMKDWHYANENPNENVYRVPPFFASDWINEYLLGSANGRENDDYRFVYMGPKGSWTPLHADVFSSFSWSVNICGKKKWVFLPPGEEDSFKDVHGNLAFDIYSDEMTDPRKYPHFSADSQQIILIQEVGDAIFVPSGWHHQVWNLDDTISFNHNWVNGCNILKMWSAMNECLKSVTEEISDCRDMEGWEEQCQLLLKSCFGMGHADFYEFVSSIALSRIEHLENDELLKVNGGWKMGRNHMMFDVIQIQALLDVMLKTDVSCYRCHRDEMESLITKIKRLKNT